MKRLYVFSIRSFVGPFLVTLAISMFILIMQFLWKYIDDLLGKGLDSWIILKLLFFVSASLIPLALPLAILLSSIMTLGNLAESNELTALKASGLSLYRIMKPLTFLVIVISIATFFFSNYIIPVANYKWHAIIYDIQNTKISALITPGVYSQSLDNYSIKVESGEGDHFQKILIHDHTDPKVIKTIRAESGKLYKSANGNYLFFELHNGYAFEELAPQTPTFMPDGTIHNSSINEHPARRTTFETATYKINISGFSFQQSKDQLFADKHEMLNVFQIYNGIDSVKLNSKKISDNFVSSMKNQMPYFQSLQFNPPKNQGDFIPDQKIPAVIDFSKLKNEDKLLAINASQSKLRKEIENLNAQYEFVKSMDADINLYWIEFYRKFSLSYAIVVLFFVGAPLGAIVRKGGFGTPVVIAALLFMIYFVLMSSGDSLARSGVVSAFVGMWFPSIILTPVALLLMRAAANDSPLFDGDSWSKRWKKISSFFGKLKKSPAN